MTPEELKQDYDIILSCWKVLKEYHDIGQEQEGRWEKVVELTNGIYKQHGTEFARHLALEVVMELERTSRGKR